VKSGGTAILGRRQMLYTNSKMFPTKNKLRWNAQLYYELYIITNASMTLYDSNGYYGISHKALHFQQNKKQEAS